MKNVTGVVAGSYKLLSDILGTGTWTYTEVCEIVKEFQCGIAANGNTNGLTVTVQLMMWETEADYEAYSSDNRTGEVINTYVHSYN